MKKILLILVSVAVVLTGCKADVSNANGTISPVYIDNTKTYKTFYLVYMPDTHVLYYTGTYTLTPYYSENGKLCRYEDGKIVEINN